MYSDMIPCISEREYYELNDVDVKHELDHIFIVQEFSQVFSDDFPILQP